MKNNKSARDMFARKMETCIIIKAACGFCVDGVCQKLKRSVPVKEIAYTRDGGLRKDCPRKVREPRIKQPEQADMLGNQ